MVYESIDLFGPDSPPSSGIASIRCIRDSEYSDTLYLYHGHGAHSLSLRPVFEALHPSEMTQIDEAAVYRALQSKRMAEVAWLLQPAINEVNEASNGVVALANLNDVYLGYALLVLTAEQQAVTVELAFRSQRTTHADERIDLAAGRQRLVEAGPTANGKSSLPSQHKAYVAFSDSSKFALPPLLARKSSTPTTRFSIPQTAGSARGARVSADGNIELTIESLRFVGQTVEKLDMSIKSLIGAGNMVQDRLELHLRELPRQVRKYQSLDDKLAERDDSFSSFSDRLERVRTRQWELERKADRVLQALIDNAQPELSVYEQRWIEELDRVKRSVRAPVAKQGTDRSLSTRAERLREQLALLKPQFQAGSQKDTDHQQNRLGDTQRAKVEATLAEEARLLSDARGKIERMQAKLCKA